MRVNGPYFDKRTGSWYLKEFRHSGRGGSCRLTYPTEQAAKAGLEKITRLLSLPGETTTQEALDAWIKSKADEVQDTRRLEVLLLDLLSPDLSRPVGKLSHDRAEALYERLIQLPVRRGGRNGATQPRSAAHHRLALTTAKGFGKWLVRQGLAKSNPFAEVKPRGRPKAGAESKVWLDPVQLGQWARTVEEAIRAGDLGDGALAAYLVYALALRASEPGTMHALQAGTPTRARFKVKGSRRERLRYLRLPLPDWIAPIFVERAERGARPLTASRHDVFRAVRAICERAKVPATCPHGLRESVIDYLAAQEAEEGGLDKRMIERMAKLHGHTPAVMQRHYLAEGRVEEGAAIGRLRVIQGGAGQKRSPGVPRAQSDPDSPTATPESSSCTWTGVPSRK